MALQPDIQNPPINLTLSSFRAAARGIRTSSRGITELARAARFIVTFNVQGNPQGHSMSKYIGSNVLGDLSYLCESTELPSRGFVNADIRHYGPNFKIPFQPQYDDITMTFLCRAEFDERYFFDDWLNVINPVESFDFEYRDNYACQINIFQFADYGENPNSVDPKVAYKFTLHNAWPIIVSPQPAVWSDDNFQRLAVTFTFTKWTKADDNMPKNIDNLVDGKPSSRIGTYSASTSFPNPSNP